MSQNWVFIFQKVLTYILMDYILKDCFQWKHFDNYFAFNMQVTKYSLYQTIEGIASGFFTRDFFFSLPKALNSR